jgi:putative SOS response-associated peptidase YedK
MKRRLFNVLAGVSLVLCVATVVLHDGKRILEVASWGLLPSLGKGRPKAKPIKVRSETVATSGMFGTAFSDAGGHVF